MVQGAEIKHNEKAKNEFTEDFRKNMDMRRQTDGPLDEKATIHVDTEYFDDFKKLRTPVSKNLKVIPIKPDS